MSSRRRLFLQPLYEILLFFAFICWINWRFFPDSMGFWDMNPHPYWIGIFLFSLRYDFFSALFSGFFATALYFVMAASPWGLWSGRDVWVFDDITFYYLPISFVVFSIMMGVVTNRQTQKMKSAENKIEVLQRQERPYQDEIQVLKKINHELEKKIVTQMSSLIFVYEGARRLESHDKNDLYDAMLLFFVRTLAAEAACIHVFEEGKFKLKISTGQDDKLQNLLEVEWGRGLIGQAALHQKITTVSELMADAKEGFDETGTLIAGPLQLGEQGEVIAIFSIQKIPLFKLNGAMKNLLLFLLKWGSRSLGRAKERFELTQNAVIDPDDGLYTEKYLHTRLSQEFTICKKYYLPLSIILLHIEDWENISHSRQKTIRAMMTEVLRSTLRKTDVMARCSHKKWQYAALLITCTEKEAKVLLEQLRANLVAVLGHDTVKLRIGLSSFHPIHQNEVTLLDEATQRLVA